MIDDEGYLSIVGRKKEIIIRGGLNIAPREIEDLLCEMPAVRAAAVIGLPDERLGEITCACLVVDDDAATRGPTSTRSSTSCGPRSRDVQAAAAGADRVRAARPPRRARSARTSSAS